MLLAAVAVSGAALADKSDRDKPVNIEADRVTIDDIKKESVFDGNVTMSQGTLMLKADKVIVKQDAGGFNYACRLRQAGLFQAEARGL